MKTLVTYATRHGATKGIAVHVGQAFERAGFDVVVRPIGQARDLEDYDAIVIGAAAYMMRWLKEATDFVRDHRAVLATKAVWTFSSGPTGTKDATLTAFAVRSMESRNSG